MKAKLTYILICAAAFCTGISCTSENKEPESGSEIRFSPPVAGRSEQTTTSNMAARGSFALYGDKTPMQQNQASGNISNVFQNREIRFENNEWRYDNVEYWFTNHEYTFVAIHPYDATTAESYSDSKLTFSFELPDDYKSTPDLLAATHRRYYAGGKALPVVLQFSHLLSLINIAPALDNQTSTGETYLEFHKLELTGFKTGATFSIMPDQRLDDDQTDRSLINIAAHTTDGSLTIDFVPAKTVPGDGTYVNLFDSNEAIMMLPQGFAANSDARIILSYTIGNDPEPKEIKEVTLPLANMQWNSGKSYTYRFTVTASSNEVRFVNAIISDWTLITHNEIDAW